MMIAQILCLHASLRQPARKQIEKLNEQFESSRTKDLHEDQKENMIMRSRMCWRLPGRGRVPSYGFDMRLQEKA